MSDDETETDIEDNAIEQMADEQPTETLTVEFPLDDFHAQIVEEIEAQSDVEVSRVIAGNHLPDIEQSVHQLYQEGKYGTNR